MRVGEMSEWWYMYMKVPVIYNRNYMHVSKYVC